MNHTKECFPIFIISLKHDIDRKEKIISLLNQYNIQYDFIDAVDYRTDAYKNIKDNVSVNSNSSYGSMTDPEMACTLSHLQAYQKIIDESLEWALILEDDVTFDERLSQVLSALSQNRNLLTMGTSYVLGGQEGTSDYLLFGLSLFKTVNIGNVLFRKATYKKHKVTRACCYIVDERYCRAAIKLFETHGFFLIDDRKILFDNNVMSHIYFTDIVTHPLVCQSNSHIENSRIEKNKELRVKTRSNIMAWLMRLRYKIRVLLGSFE